MGAERSDRLGCMSVSQMSRVAKGRRGTRTKRGRRILPVHADVQAYRCRRLWMMMAVVGHSPSIPLVKVQLIGQFN
jgi:hypothetical protein